MGLWMFFSLVARAATLGNSCNLHKSKMTAMDSGWDTILQLVNSESCVIHLYNIILPGELMYRVTFVIRGQYLGQRSI